MKTKKLDRKEYCAVKAFMDARRAENRKRQAQGRLPLPMAVMISCACSQCKPFTLSMVG